MSTLPRALILSLLTACSGPEKEGGPTGDSAGGGAVEPFDVYRHISTAELSPVRGWSVQRGAIHVHSVYSHDACDGLGFTNADGSQDYETGSMNQQCFDDLRQGICDAQLDWVFLTDHNSYFPHFEYPDVLLYVPGDTLIEEPDGSIWSSRMACGDGREVLTSAGIDVDILGIGLRGHVAPTPKERSAIYGARDASTVAAIQANGGLALGGYIPDWEEDIFLSMPWDGIEVFNPVHNLRDRMTDVLSLLGRMTTEPESVPVPELGLYAVFEENVTNLERWAQLSQLQRAPSFLGANAHRNVLQEPTWDGERLDSYRRTFHWFSNYALLEPDVDHTMETVKAAISAGRTYGAYDAVGTPDGFDFVADVGGTLYEMGAEVPFTGTETITLRVVSPTVAGLGPDDLEPTIRSRILRAEADGTWTEMAEGAGTVEAVVDVAGAYRAEVRITPTHLTPVLGSPEEFLREVLWVYGNLIYVGMPYAE